MGSEDFAKETCISCNIDHAVGYKMYSDYCVYDKKNLFRFLFFLQDRATKNLKTKNDIYTIYKSIKEPHYLTLAFSVCWLHWVSLSDTWQACLLSEQECSSENRLGNMNLSERVLVLIGWKLGCIIQHVLHIQ